MPLDTMVSVCVCVCVYTQLRLTLCNPVDHNPQAPLSVGFPRLEYWSGLPFPSLGDLPNLGIEPRSLAFYADSLSFEPPGKPYTSAEDATCCSVTQLCPALCDPMDCSMPGFPVFQSSPGVFLNSCLSSQ